MSESGGEFHNFACSKKLLPIKSKMLSFTERSLATLLSHSNITTMTGRNKEAEHAINCTC